MRTNANDRWHWLPIFAAVAVWLAFLAITLVPEWRATARVRLPWMLEPLFHDWHVVRLGWEASVAGVDPLADKNDPFNYPRFVLLGAALGRHVPPNVAALTGAALFLAALVWVLRPRSRGEALLAAALVMSPPVLLLVERGNLDAWVFALVAVGIDSTTGASERMATFGGGMAALVAAAMVKLYPAVLLPAAVCFWRGRRRVWALVACAAFGAWFALSLDEIALVMAKTTRGYEVAYGRMVAGSRYFAEVIAGRGSSEITLSTLMMVSIGAFIGGLFPAVVYGFLKRVRFAAVEAAAREQALFLSGALIYAGTFFLGSNWAYRLVFLTLCVPWLWRAIRTPAVRIWALASLVGVAVMMLAPFHLPLGWFLAQQAAGWALAFTLLYGTVALLSGGLSACASEGAECSVPAHE